MHYGGQQGMYDTSLGSDSYVIGPITLNRSSMVLSGPTCRAALGVRCYRVLERLMRRSGSVVETNEVVAAMFDDPDREPPTALAMVRNEIRTIRRMLMEVGAGQQVTIRTVVGMGYAVERAELG